MKNELKTHKISTSLYSNNFVNMMAVGTEVLQQLSSVFPEDNNNHKFGSSLIIFVI